METFMASYTGVQVNKELYKEVEGVLPKNDPEALTEFVKKAVGGFIFKKDDGNVGYKGFILK